MRLLFQSGVSIVQGLVLSSVLAGSALVATRMIEDQKKLQKTVETRDQIEQLHKIVYSVLQNREHCLKNSQQCFDSHRKLGWSRPINYPDRQ